MIWLQWQSQCHPELQNIYCTIATWSGCMTCICQKVFPCLWIVVWLTSICWCQRYCCRRTMDRGWRCTGMFHFCGSLAAGLGCQRVWGPCGTSAPCASFESSSASSCHGGRATPPCWQCPPGAWGRSRGVQMISRKDTQGTAGDSASAPSVHGCSFPRSHWSVRFATASFPGLLLVERLTLPRWTSRWLTAARQYSWCRLWWRRWKGEICRSADPQAAPRHRVYVRLEAARPSWDLAQIYVTPCICFLPILYFPAKTPSLIPCG